MARPVNVDGAELKLGLIPTEYGSKEEGGNLERLRAHYAKLKGVSPKDMGHNYMKSYDIDIVEAAMQGIPPRIWAARNLIATFRLKAWAKQYPSFMEALAVSGQIIEDYYLCQCQDLVYKPGISGANMKAFEMIVKNVLGWNGPQTDKNQLSMAQIETGNSGTSSAEDKRARIAEIIQAAVARQEAEVVNGHKD